MFRLCLNSLIARPDPLLDEQADIMEKIVGMLERSICTEAYSSALHCSTQQICISLLKMLTPPLSYLELMEADPEQFVQIGEDFAMEQSNEMLITRAGSLLSALCMSIDGYLSFLGSMLIMILKRFDGSIEQLPDAPQMRDYFLKIDEMYDVEQQWQVATSFLMLSCLSDQMEKRQDLYRPLCLQVRSMNHLFKMEQCPFAPVLICRFMMLTAFYPFPGCMDVFLPFKNVKPVYDCQLQTCYRILMRYSNTKSEHLRAYIKQIEPIMILSDNLTPTLETSIMDDRNDLPLAAQFMIMEKLVLWMLDATDSNNIVKCNKVSALIAKLIGRMVPEPAMDTKTEEALFGYLERLYTAQLGEQTHSSEQYTVEIAIAHVRQFPCLQANQARVGLFMSMSYSITIKNSYIMNNCMELLGEMVGLLGSSESLSRLVEGLLGWLGVQEREEEVWEYFYLLELAILRMGWLQLPLPFIDCQLIDSYLHRTTDKVLATQIMMFLYSLQYAGSQQPLQAYLK